MREKLLTAKQAAERTATPVKTLYKWAKEIDHPFPKPIKVSEGRAGLRWIEREVDRFIDRQLAERDKQTESKLELIRRAG